MPIRFSPVLAVSLFTLAPILAIAQPVPFERSLNVGAAPTLDVSTGSGNITVRAGAPCVVLRLVTPNRARGASTLPRSPGGLAAAPPIAQTGDAVRVGRTRTRQPPHGRVDSH